MLDICYTQPIIECAWKKVTLPRSEDEKDECESIEDAIKRLRPNRAAIWDTIVPGVPFVLIGYGESCSPTREWAHHLLIEFELASGETWQGHMAYIFPSTCEMLFAPKNARAVRRIRHALIHSMVPTLRAISLKAICACKQERLPPRKFYVDHLPRYREPPQHVH